MKERKTIFRVEKVKGYSVIDNTAGNDDRLSYGARGIMYKALTKPDDWKFYIQDFANHSPDGVTKVTSYFKELRQAGYIEYKKIRNDLGHIIDSEYIFHEKPLHYNEFRKAKKVSSNLIKGFHRNSEKPIHGETNTREKQYSENPMLLNTDIKLNTNNEVNTDKSLEKNPISTSLLMEIKAKLKKINENLKIPYIESGKANQKYDIASKSFEGNFDELFQDTLKKLSDLSTQALDSYSCIRQGVTIESLTAFNCKLMSAIAIEHSKKFSKTKLVEVKKQVLPEKEQQEKEIMEFVKYFSGKTPSFPIDKLGKHLQQDQRVIAIYDKAG